MSDPKENYLGDGLYISFDGYQARVFTYNGVESSDEVFVDPDVAKTLTYYDKPPTRRDTQHSGEEGI